MSSAYAVLTDSDTHFRPGKDQVKENGVSTVSQKDYENAKHPEFLPTWNKNESFTPIGPFEFKDRGFYADSHLKNLIPDPSQVELVSITPKLGTEVRSGIQLSELTAEQKDDLALLVETRGVVVFRDQDFKYKGPEFARNWGQHFGPLHIHASSGAPEGFPEFHVTYRRADAGEFQRVFQDRTSLVLYHSDVSYEPQPPGITSFVHLQGPNGGGDTLFSDLFEAYDRLSPAFQKVIENLKVVHTSRDQAENSRNNGGIERRAPVESIHPLVRYHPVTGKKSLFVNSSFCRRIVGFKKEESDALLEFLFRHVETSLDFQLRARWEEGTVAIWDNRRVIHTATLDWDTPEARHCFRITPLAEKPVTKKEYYAQLD